MITALLLLWAVTIASMLIVGRIARSQGRSTTPWLWTAVVVGPLAIPLLYALPRKGARQPHCS